MNFMKTYWISSKFKKMHGIYRNPQLFLSRSKTPIKPIGLLMVLECPWPPNPEIPPENMKNHENMKIHQKSVKWTWIGEILGKYGGNRSVGPWCLPEPLRNHRKYCCFQPLGRQGPLFPPKTGFGVKCVPFSHFGWNFLKWKEKVILGWKWQKKRIPMPPGPKHQ